MNQQPSEADPHQRIDHTSAQRRAILKALAIATPVAIALTAPEPAWAQTSACDDNGRC